MRYLQGRLTMGLIKTLGHIATLGILTGIDTSLDTWEDKAKQAKDDYDNGKISRDELLRRWYNATGQHLDSR